MHRVLNKLIILCALLLSIVAVQAQLPHEVLLLVNKNSQPSKHVANVFAALRGIPEHNIIHLDIPASVYAGTATISPEDFTKLIWEPANATALERGINKHILAWVYSVDFPIRVDTDSYDRKQMSVTGVTFVRNQIPGLKLAEEGKYHSKLFAGPNDRQTYPLPSTSLGVRKNGIPKKAKLQPEAEILKIGLRDEMPLPSMHLGYIGEKGNDVETVLSMLHKGKLSDYRGQRRNIFFIESDDVRSTCREWLFKPVTEELKKLGYIANVTTNFPAGTNNVMGIMMGSESIDAKSVGSFAPGAVADHLTSWGAEFQKRQSKITEWIKAGACGTAGTVVEPYSNPNKFPNARFFVHYGTGCTILESYYQAIACPLQILLIGDPLARPYNLPVKTKILGAEKITKPFTYMTQAECRIKGAQYDASFLIDGKLFQKRSEKLTAYIDVEKLSDGYHELRANIYMQNNVNFSTYQEKPFIVDRMGRSISISNDITKQGDHKNLIKVNVDGVELPLKVKLVCGGRVLDEKEYDHEMQLVLNELETGEGPNRLRAIAVYTDGMEVSSTPINFTIAFNNEEKKQESSED